MFTSVATPQTVDTPPQLPPECSLEVHKHPFESFYKDEGGKANHLTVVASLPQSFHPDGDVPIKAVLYYESGIEVEDGDKIFKVLSFEPDVLSASRRSTELKFRIEKVSRRKDGQRFKVRFDVDMERAAKTHSIGGVFTSPVCVYSKRKFTNNSGDGVSGNKKVSRKFSSGNVCLPSRKRGAFSPGNTVAQQRNSAAEKLATRLATTEKKLEKMCKAMERQAARIATLESALQGRAEEGRYSNNKYYSPAPVVFDDIDPIYLKQESENSHLNNTLRPLPFKRLKSADLPFNFGQPCTSPIPLVFEFEAEEF